jgi:hypothetical protein
MATDRTAAPPVTSSTPESVAVAPCRVLRVLRESGERRHYAPPQLRHLGSVRDLTLGVRNASVEPGMAGMHA